MFVIIAVELSYNQNSDERLENYLHKNNLCKQLTNS